MINCIKNTYQRLFNIKPMSEEDYTAILIDKAGTGYIR